MGKKNTFTLNEGTAVANGSAATTPAKFTKIGDVDGVAASNGSHLGPKQNGNAKEKDVEVKVKTAEKDEKAKIKPMVGVFEVFRFSDAKDRLLMFIGTLCACAHGASMPLMVIVFGNMTNAFVNNEKLTNYMQSVFDNITSCLPDESSDALMGDPQATIGLLMNTNNTACIGIANTMSELGLEGVLDQMRHNALYYVYLGCAVVVVGYIQMACWQTAGLNQGQKVRCLLLRSILRQDIGWFDTHEVGELNTRLVDDVDQIEAGIGDKMSLFFQYMVQMVAGLVVGFVKGWKLTLVILAVSPLLAVAGGIMGRIGSTMAKKELHAYAKAGAVAEEVISAMRTVTAFGGQNKEVVRYRKNLMDAKAFGIKKGWITGIGMGSIFMIMFGSYGLAFWYGSELVRSDPAHYSAGVMLTVFFAVLIGAFSVGNAAPHMTDFSNARGAAHVVYGLIDMVSSIDSSSTDGIQLAQVIGNIEFRNVRFTYPSRPDAPVLNGLQLKISKGQTVALVGSSGCGKSTTVQLLQRFYDPLEGQVLIDGVDIRTMNIQWLRQRIGVVSQEPVLFGTTIAENIKYGLDGVTMEEVMSAAKNANAHDFIMQLPKKYDTLVGERGAQLSGGQKQRIAIARALVRDPKILLLDEATSALDTESESTVQAALDKARLGRTTIVIAHRLSTVRTADYIAGISGGKVAEHGMHEELMKTQGIYYQLVTNQTMKNQKTDGNVLEDIDEESVGISRDEKLRGNSFLRNPSVMDRTLSVTSAKSAKEEEKESDEFESIKPSTWRLMKMNGPEWPYIVIATIAAIINGCVQPSFAFIFSEVLGVFSIVDLDEQKRKVNLLCGMFAVLGLVAAITMTIMNGMYGRTGELLTMRVRTLTFKTILKQEIAYFDDRRHTTGALCSRLATDASIVRGAAGSRIGYVVQAIAGLSFGLIIGFIYSWELTLVVLAFAPFTLVSAFIQLKVVHSKGAKNDPIEQAATIAVEAIENIRTVATLTKEERFYQNYYTEAAKIYSKRRRDAQVISIAFSVSQSIIFWADAACFTFGAYLIQQDKLTYDNMFKVFFAVIFGAMAAGRATSFAPDYGKAMAAAGRLFALFDRVPCPDSSSEEGTKMTKVDGSVDLNNVVFQYPTRPDVTVLKDVSLQVKPGQMVALVGSSGCGKSTIVQLIERFYNPAEGSLSLDGHKIDSLNIQWLRSQIGIVSQEPVLFDCSIRENIAYGDNSREVPMDEIINAAKQANIHNFIQTLPEGYETCAGDKGAQLSGGQKQRIAIARALIRNPKILLLDEATSALDTESEKIVQEALEKAQQGRTSIVIAHRLSTIQNAHNIIVFKLGKVVETGTHSQLMAKQGVYYKLNTTSVH